MQMVESRRTERVRCFLRAKIVFNNKRSTFDCTIRNISATGAKIEVGEAASIPARFDLEIPQRGRTYRAQILWRDKEAMGVEFVTDDEAHAGAGEVGDTRLEQLERENRRLRTAVAELTKRLEDIGQAVDHIL
jgi:hypothetical protein